MAWIGPDRDKDQIESSQNWEPPRNPVNHDGLCMGGGELINDSCGNEEVDDRPGEEGPIGWGKVRLFDVVVNGPWGYKGIGTWPKEEDAREDVDGLEEETFFPMGRSHSCYPSPGRGRGEAR